MSSSILTLGIHKDAHDTTAVLVRDGVVVAAIEEERLNRIKHTSAFPSSAIRACLDVAKATISDVSLVAFNNAESSENAYLEIDARSQVVPGAFDARSWATKMLRREGFSVDSSKFRFVPHHLAHAASAFMVSGFDQSLVVSLDGIGNHDETRFASGIIVHGTGNRLSRLRILPEDASLGFFYGQITKLLGFSEHDEYKVMGLASYGQPDRYRTLFSRHIALEPNGRYSIDRLALIKALVSLVGTHDYDRGRPGQVSRDVAAAAQEALEMIVLHTLRHYRQETGLEKIALAGGVALNCALIGRISRSRLFKEVFVQPASHDAGGALGAALFVSASERPDLPLLGPLQNVYWGRDIPNNHDLDKLLYSWSEFIGYERVANICHKAAGVIANGSVIGWIQGRSEFGPRALGNRSIVADPRSSETRDRVNRMIKRREDFRPFAPAVHFDKVSDYFEVDLGFESQQFMTSLVKVRPEQKERLAAVTHIDGTARIQTVTPQQNRIFWDIINEFGTLTGVFVLLNTSFNNSAEPIVDSPNDAIVAFLTTDLNYLVIGDYFIWKKTMTDDLLWSLAPQISTGCVIGMAIEGNRPIAWGRYRQESALAVRKPTEVSKETLSLLAMADGKTSLSDLSGGNRGPAINQQITADIRNLWWLRIISMIPSIPNMSAPPPSG